MKKPKDMLPVVVESSSDSSQLQYVQLVFLVASFFIALYGGFEYLRQSLLEYLIVTIVSGGVFLTSFMFLGKNHLEAIERTKKLELPNLSNSLTAHPLYKKYEEIRNDIEGFTKFKKDLLEGTIIIQLKELIELKLPLMLSRKKDYGDYFKRCNQQNLDEEIDQLNESLKVEEDEDIKNAISRNLAIAQSTKSNYHKLEKALKLYDLQIATISHHLKNIDSKIHILDLKTDLEDAAKDVIEDITTDINDIEQALAQIELPEPDRN